MCFIARAARRHQYLAAGLAKKQNGHKTVKGKAEASKPPLEVDCTILTRCTASAVPNASFITETSFADAPLNSRLVNNNASPRKERITTKRLRQIITNTGDEDDEADLQQLDDQSISDGEDDEPPKEDLNQADLSIQEALLIEDLLSVLIVSSHSRRMLRLFETKTAFFRQIGHRWTVHNDGKRHGRRRNKRRV
jgi:hypothetical protein